VDNRSNKLAIILIFGLILKFTFFNFSQAQTTSTTLSSMQQKEIIESFSQALLKHYVVPDKANQLVDVLSQAQIKNEFSSPKTINAFLTQANNIIQITSQDKHLRLLTPEKYNQMMIIFYGDAEHDQAPSEQNLQTKISNHGNGHSASHHLPSSSAANSLSVVGVSNVSEISRDGLNQTGYLALERFDASVRSMSFINRVFGTFTESDNIIIDLRNCGGGDAEMVNTLSSYFFDKPTHLLNTTMPSNDNSIRTVVERWTIPNELSPYFANKPLKILVSSKTFSAAESFAFGMQVSGRAILVGETTGGGGYTNDFFPLPYGIGASISVGRTYDHRTGNDWQSVGVIPDIQIEKDHALHAALTSFTKQSGKLDKIKGENNRIYQQIQKYTNAWYGADKITMKSVLSDKFIGIYHDQKGDEVESISAQELITNTAKGKGVRKNKIHYNRIIRNIDVTKNEASVTLILRETVHHMLLIKRDNKWLIVRDEYSDKLHS
tara:strand:- start:7684 stop:9162 length:1479 start_codon:yes stop_codon:yes gene_type:complete